MSKRTTDELIESLEATITELQTKVDELERDINRYTNGYKGGCWTCETVGEKNIELAIRNAELTVKNAALQATIEALQRYQEACDTYLMLGDCRGCNALVMDGYICPSCGKDNSLPDGED